MFLRLVCALVLLLLASCERSPSESDQIAVGAPAGPISSTESKRVELSGFAIASIHGVCIADSINSRDCVYVEVSEYAVRGAGMTAFDESVRQQIRGVPIYLQGRFSGTMEDSGHGGKLFKLYDVLDPVNVPDGSQIEDERN